eukprot:NODE_2768_length_1346_cov_111.376942_g2630_i0.p1 GENE.NODE_2768_length_1346_cov_111.376942_g2630_i0~~NODE_2768_length_1346_cov_111.376942_g2630_i0.p1  ORF type:complete len:393 (+),score=37.25 NODE_2768_length_1346_cov_111.376942_g2630_i0:111-1289(+)
MAYAPPVPSTAAHPVSTLNPVHISPTPATTPIPGEVFNRIAIGDLQPKCISCEQTYLREDITPHLLTCGHSLCGGCVAEKTDKEKDEVVCPVDESRTAVSAVKINYALEDVERPADTCNAAEVPISELAEQIGVVCRICMEEYSQERLPYALPCGHTFCGVCIRSMFTPDGKLPCPNRCAVQEVSMASRDSPQEPTTTPLNRGILSVVNALRMMSGLTPAEAREAPPPPSPQPITAATAQPVHMMPLHAPVRRAHTGFQLPESKLVQMIIFLYILAAAAVAFLVGITGDDCIRLKEWLIILAIILVLIPCVLYSMKIFPRGPWTCGPCGCPLSNVLGFIFVVWIGLGANRVSKNDYECPRSSRVWLTSAVLVAIHVCMLITHCMGELWFHRR